MKRALRDRGRSLAPPKETRSLLSARVTEHLIRSALFAGARQVGVFYGLPWEPDLSGVWRARPDACYYPRVEPPHAMRFFRVRDLGELTSGYARIPEPPGREASSAAAWAEGDLVLVPGAAFDAVGGRVGSGMGFYDRFLAGNPARRIGVCFASQIVKDALAQEPFDARMDGLCSEAGLTFFT